MHSGAINQQLCVLFKPNKESLNFKAIFQLTNFSGYLYKLLVTGYSWVE